MSKGLYKFFWDCGRMGVVEGAFVASVARVEKAVGSSVYFGEILGKHSEVHGMLDKDDLTLVTTDEKVLEVLGDFSVGYNPLDYMEDDEDEE